MVKGFKNSKCFRSLIKIIFRESFLCFFSEDDLNDQKCLPQFLKIFIQRIHVCLLK